MNYIWSFLNRALTTNYETSSTFPSEAPPVPEANATPFFNPISIENELTENNSPPFHMQGTLKALWKDIEKSKAMAKTEGFSIFIRRSESWVNLRNRLEMIQNRYFSDPNVLKWVFDWKKIVNTIEVADVKLKLLTYKNQFESSKDECLETKNILDQLLYDFRQQISAQLNDEKYADYPYREMLNYLNEYWPALTIFSENPNVPMNEEGIFFELKKACPKDTEILNVGRPILLSVSPENSWEITISRTFTIPLKEKEAIERIGELSKEILKQCHSDSLGSIAGVKDQY